MTTIANGISSETRTQLVTMASGTNDLTPVKGIWDDDEGDLFVFFDVAIKFAAEVFGGIPQKPEIIESWLRTKVLEGDDEVRLMVLKTLQDLGHELPESGSYDEMMTAVKVVAAQRNGKTFRRDSVGLFLHRYNIKAMLKECVNILYAGETYVDDDGKTHKKGWGPTRKGALGYFEERIFVDTHRAYLMRDARPLTQPDGVHLQIGHVMGPKGKQSTLDYFDYCWQPEMTFRIKVLRDATKELTPKRWKEIFLQGQEIGMGALRSLSYGSFKVTKFVQVE